MPQRGLIGLRAVPESRLGSEHRGIIIPDIIATRQGFSQRWIGQVFAIGDNVSKDIAWGDVVELSRWTGVCWFTRLGAWLTGTVGCSEYVLADNDRGLKCDGDDLIAFVTQDQILFKIDNVDGTSDDQLQPLAFRCRVRIDEPEMVGNIHLPDWKKKTDVGLVEAVGAKVEDVLPGQYVKFVEDAGTKVFQGGVTYMFINEEDIILASDEVIE